ncbi:AAWKG family protein (plasmid) [Streptomyces scopuliridis]|uniref:AAWKG family protein n=1 Tax=Streptomyces scopuliridis TaxID=452529 RepID=A0ACD4ZYW8_9ACTN|nr:AAWKG family protein [Streptomyces scopuliridis]WSC03498.1 AAWKG family protein [Streptomyces scopuliridis]WSC11357.1 AAWKG family protein [Streptomyces scopuliridis]
MADESDHWARAVEAFTGYPMPSRGEVFEGVNGLEPEGNAPLLKVVIEDRDFMEMTEDAYYLYSGPNKDGHDFVIHFFLPGQEDPETTPNLDEYNDDELKEKIYPKLRKVLIDFVGRDGTDVELNQFNPFGWSKGDGGSLSGMENNLGAYVEGAGNALYNSGYQNIVGNTNVGFSSNGRQIDVSRAMDFSTFTRTAEAYDRVAKFFTDHAETIKQWKESLGEENAAWKGKAAEVFANMIDGLHKNYVGFADQMHPKDFTTAHQSQWDWYAASSEQGDAILGAGNAVFQAIRDLSAAHTDWESGTNVDPVALVDAGGDPIKYLPGLGSPYGILYSMLQSAHEWAYNNNARFAVKGTQSGSSYSPGNSPGSGSWRPTEAHFYTLLPEAKVTIPGLGNLNDVSTWAGLGTKAVESWNEGVDEHLAPAADVALSTVNNAFIEAQRVIDKLLEPEVTSYTGAGGSGGGGGGDEEVDIDEINAEIDKINAEAEAAIAEANAAAEAAIAEAKAAIEEANAEAEAAIAEANAAAEAAIAEANAAAEESNAEAETAIDEANAAAEAAIAEANAAADEANANAENAINEANEEADTLLDESNAEAEAAINEANNQVTEIRDQANLQMEEANNQANEQADQANADAEAAINDANAQVDQAIQEANNQAQTVIDDANEQLGNGNGSSLPPGLGNNFVTHQPPGNPLGNKPGGVTNQNPDGSVTTDFPDGTEQVIDPDGTITQTDPDGTVTVTRPDGSVTITDPDGNVQTSGPGGGNLTGPGGQTIVDGPSGEIITRPDGSTIVDGPGGRTETSSDGTVKVTGPDGSTQVTSPDGTITVTSPDGSSSVTSPDGSSKVTLPDGTVQETAPDGEITLTEPDGTVTVTSPDGSAKVTMPDGTVQEVSADGTVKVTSPDGSTVVEGPGNHVDVPGNRVDGPGNHLDNPGNRVDVPRTDVDYPDGEGGQVTIDTPNGPANGPNDPFSDLRDHGNTGSRGDGGLGGEWGQEEYPYDDPGPENSGRGEGTSDNPFSQGDQGGPGSSALGGPGSGGGSPMMPPMGGMQNAGGDSTGERERSNPGSRISRPAPRRGSTAAQAASRRAAALREQEMHEDVVVTGSGAPAAGMMPPPAQRSEATQSGDRERANWLAENEDVWGTDEGTTPAVIGR